MPNYEWVEMPVALKCLSEDPWVLWRLQQPALASPLQLLCEAGPTLTPAVAEAAAWQVPQVYASDAVFFTARRLAGAAQGNLRLPGRTVGGLEVL